MMSTRVGNFSKGGHVMALKTMHELKIKIYVAIIGFHSVWSGHQGDLSTI